MTAQRARQLVLDLPHRPALGRDDFLVAPCNKEAVAWIDRWPEWPGNILALWGPPAAGKTHLMEVWRRRSGGELLSPEALADDGWVAAAKSAVAMDGLAPPFPEQALLHAINWARAHRGSILLVAERAPSTWPVALADLRSRLHTMPTAAIGPPDELLLEAVLVKQFTDRQMRIGPDAVRYIVRRTERSFEAARRIVDVLDQRALAEKRTLTIPFIKTALIEELGPEA